MAVIKSGFKSSQNIFLVTPRAGALGSLEKNSSQSRKSFLEYRHFAPFRKLLFKKIKGARFD